MIGAFLRAPSRCQCEEAWEGVLAPFWAQGPFPLVVPYRRSMVDRAVRGQWGPDEPVVAGVAFARRAGALTSNGADGFPDGGEHQCAGLGLGRNPVDGDLHIGPVTIRNTCWSTEPMPGGVGQAAAQRLPVGEGRQPRVHDRGGRAPGRVSCADPGAHHLRGHPPVLGDALRPGPGSGPHRPQVRPRHRRPRGLAMPDATPHPGAISDLDKNRALLD